MSSDPLRQARQAAKSGEWGTALDVLTEALRRGELDENGTNRAGRQIGKILGNAGSERIEQNILVLGTCTTTWLVTQLTAACWARGSRARVTDVLACV